MRIELDNNSFNLGVVIAGIVGLVTLILVIVHDVQITNRVAFQNGYIQREVTSSTETLWQLPEK